MNAYSEDPIDPADISLPPTEPVDITAFLMDTEH